MLSVFRAFSPGVPAVRFITYDAVRNSIKQFERKTVRPTKLVNADVEPLLDQISELNGESGMGRKPKKKQQQAYKALLHPVIQGASSAIILKVFDAYSAFCNPSVKEHTKVINALGRNSDTAAARAILDRMPPKGLSPNSVAYNAMISAYCKAGQVAEAEDLMVTMEEAGVSPNLRTYTTIVNGCNKHGRPLHALQALEQMTEAGIKPDRVLYTTLIATYSAAGEIERAKELIPEMKAAGIQPDAWTYNNLIKASNQMGAEMLDAFELLAQMKTDKVQPDNVSYTSLIRLCAKNNDADLGFLLLEDMLAGGVKPSVRTYSALVAACCAAKKLAKAAAVFDLMSNQGLTPNLESYNIMLLGCRSQGDSAKAVSTLKTLCSSRAGSPTADKFAFENAMWAAIKSRNLSDAMVVDEMARDAAIRFVPLTTRAFEGLRKDIGTGLHSST